MKYRLPVDSDLDQNDHPTFCDSCNQPVRSVSSKAKRITLNDIQNKSLQPKIISESEIKEGYGVSQFSDLVKRESDRVSNSKESDSIAALDLPHDSIDEVYTMKGLTKKRVVNKIE